MTLLAKTLRRQVAALSCGCSLAIAGLGSQVASGATFTVSNTSDAGPGSFRQAIADANAAPGLDTIAFQILSPPFRISPGSALPAITDPTIIDATTQGSLVELDGSSAGAATVGLRLLSSNSVVRGLVINMFGLEGIHIEGPGSNVVAGNFIGTDITGTLNRGNGAATATSPSPGIFVLGSTGNLIGGTNGADRNVISGNAGAGVFIQNAGGNTVLGNYIGTTMLGTVSLGNGNNGISVYTSSQNTIGGVSSSARNVLAGNAGSGLYLQAGSSSNVIQGNYIGADVTGAAAMANAGDGITLQGSVNNLIGGTNNGAGNIISGNTKAGISFFGEAPDNLVQGNRIGTSASGSAALGNGLDGITLTNSPGNLIGGTTVAARNLISGNHQNGILILNGSFGTIIQGNFIGTSADGTNALANTQNGLNIETWDNTVGGTTSAARNLISGNGLDGIFIIGLGTTNNSVQGNYLGTRLNGASALHNGRAGLGVSSNAFYNLIGGTASGAGNLISGNFDAGLYLIGTSGNLVQGNIIGADASGTVAIPNAIEGMYVQYAVTNLIGGTVAGARNLISGNSTSGMFLTNSSWNTIQGNYIGTAADGVSPLGNGNTALGFNTLDLQPDSHNNVIGGAQPGAGNIIAYAPFLNTIHYAGVRIRNGCSNNLVSANSIFANQGLPIDLGTFGVSPNDHCDADGGATQGNQGQNFPVLSQAVAANGMVIRGTLDSTASSTFVLQFFGNPACTAWTNYGQAQFYLGQVAVTTSNDCTTSFSAQVSGTVPPGYVVTATATDSRNNTSESSACVSVGAAPPLNISPPSSHQITVYWTTNFAAGFVLQRTGDLTPPAQWSNVSNVPATNAGNYSVTLAVGPTNQFYRLAFQ